MKKDTKNQIKLVMFLLITAIFFIWPKFITFVISFYGAIKAHEYLEKIGEEVKKNG